MYISAHLVHSSEGWKLRLAEASHLRETLFDVVDHVCGATNHRLICRYRWGLRLLSSLAQDHMLLQMRLTRQQAMKISPAIVTRTEEDPLTEDE